MYEFLWKILSILSRLFWRLLRVFYFVEINSFYGDRYVVKIFKPGFGMHFKYLLTDRDSGHQFLLKKTCFYIEWWQRVVLKYHPGNILNSPYCDLSFDTISSNLLFVLSCEEVRLCTLLNSVNMSRREIWYDYIDNAKFVDFSNESNLFKWGCIKGLLEKYDLFYVDDISDNILECNGELKLIDLESLVLNKSLES